MVRMKLPGCSSSTWSTSSRGYRCGSIALIRAWSKTGCPVIDGPVIDCSVIDGLPCPEGRRAEGRGEPGGHGAVGPYGRGLDLPAAVARGGGRDVQGELVSAERRCEEAHPGDGPQH